MQINVTLGQAQRDELQRVHSLAKDIDDPELHRRSVVEPHAAFAPRNFDGLLFF